MDLKTKVLVVDDSIVFRTSITQALSSEYAIDVVGSASNGKVAIDMLKKNPSINLITLDMEMPVMDGMETIKEIRSFNKDIVIIVFSSQTLAGAEKTIKALSLGANDFVTKVESRGTIESSIEMIRQELAPRIKALAEARVRSIKKAPAEVSRPSTPADSVKKFREMLVKPKLICLGSSTGGPDTLSKIFSQLNYIDVPMLLVQHMPPIFTSKLAEALNNLSENTVLEAQDGYQLKPGTCYLAPGNYHMVIDRNGIIRLNQEEKVCFVRPSVDVLFESVAENFKEQVLSLVLTGMGSDGANGCRALKRIDAYMGYQNEESCVVFGMPAAVANANVGAVEVDLALVPTLLNGIAKRP